MIEVVTVILRPRHVLSVCGLFILLENKEMRQSRWQKLKDILDNSVALCKWSLSRPYWMDWKRLFEKYKDDPEFYMNTDVVCQIIQEPGDSALLCRKSDFSIWVERRFIWSGKTNSSAFASSIMFWDRFFLACCMGQDFESSRNWSRPTWCGNYSRISLVWSAMSTWVQRMRAPAPQCFPYGNDGSDCGNRHQNP